MVDQPATLTVAIDPPRPRVGDRVTFTFQWSDVDADVPYIGFASGAYSCEENRRGVACGSGPTAPSTPPATIDPAPVPTVMPVGPAPMCRSRLTGPWTPPPPRGAAGSITETATYSHPGTYTWWADLSIASSTYAAWAQLNPHACSLLDPYASHVRIMQVIEVGATTSTTSTTARSSATSTG